MKLLTVISIVALCLLTSELESKSTDSPKAPTEPKETLSAFQKGSDDEGESVLWRKQTLYTDPNTAAWYQERASALCAVAIYAKTKGDLPTAQKIARRALLQLVKAEKCASRDADTLAAIEELRGDIALQFLGDSDEAKQHYLKVRSFGSKRKTADDKLEGAQ